jgi:hypothetical protein
MATDPDPSKSRSAGKATPSRPVCAEAHYRKEPLGPAAESRFRPRDRHTEPRAWLAAPYHASRADAAQRAGDAIENLPRQKDGGSRYRIAGEPTEPTP